MTCGVYLLRFSGTDKVYVGISENIERRWGNHKYSMKNAGWPIKLQQAYLEYGEPFLEILCECAKKDLELNEREAIEIFNSIHNGFNSRDAGACGAGISISGETNGRSVYSNTQVEQAFELLTSTLLTHKEIADRSGISIQAVSHISAGTGHTWLRSKFPIEYTELMSKKRVTRGIFNPINILNIQTGVLTTISSYKELQDLTGCGYSTAVSLVSGKAKSIYGKYKLQQAVTCTKLKKAVYTLQHEQTNEVVQVYSKLDFFKSKNLTNRRKLTEFFKEAALNSVYQSWKLVSISHDNVSTHSTSNNIRV